MSRLRAWPPSSDAVAAAAGAAAVAGFLLAQAVWQRALLAEARGVDYGAGKAYALAMAFTALVAAYRLLGRGSLHPRLLALGSAAALAAVLAHLVRLQRAGGTIAETLRAAGETLPAGLAPGPEPACWASLGAAALALGAAIAGSARTKGG